MYIIRAHMYICGVLCALHRVTSCRIILLFYYIIIKVRDFKQFYVAGI